jgi:YidC/Oxa1 family membrane protein insertase
MGDIVVQLSILDPLYTLFGWLTRVLFGFFGNYGLAIIFLTIIIRAALIPLNVKSQKSMLKMQAMSGKQAELQRIYGDDKEKYREEVMKLQKENGAGGLSGCLLPILQIFIIWPMFRIVSGPLIYLSGVSKTNIQSMISLGNSLGEGGIFAAQMTAENHIGLIKALNENSQFLNECINRGFIKLDQMIDLHFLGMDLTVTPAWKPSVIASDPKISPAPHLPDPRCNHQHRFDAAHEDHEARLERRSRG